ncbi:urea carboxylase [Isoalcanivorax pacificus W11-5]|uniref:Biotin carboxylase n=1 Tax=Isoalcanivorax pacificus W11-5 TaxID=391936 RepID=A0A0B4XRG5_9GAMM|nr:urea carboxylase [Isoalcanivorax pacificus]AJD48847.1 urea carboxylase [Isoalcanivorax pacificus W11-5]
MFSKVLIANRGAIACRIIRTLKELGIQSVALYSRADAGSLHVQQADQAICLGEGGAGDTYLNIDKVIAAARDSGAQAIHPGYGFLSENLTFAAACEAAGIVFIGPAPEQIEAFGLKHTARALAESSDVPLLPGSGLLDDVQAALREAERIGYPVMLKSTAGGGGIGMQRCFDAAQLQDAFASVQRLSRNNFSNDGLFLEKFVQRARHIEVQIFGDGDGHVVALGERDCSLQRRNQKVVEEAPAPNLPVRVRDAMMTTAVRLGERMRYRSAGTVEFIYDDQQQAFYFLEVNTRLQVEHGVTEEITGVDLVGWMIRLAAGERDFVRQYVHRPAGHAIQVRVYAEDPARGFQPSAGRLTAVQWPAGVRCDTWVEAGTEVPALYDPMLAKVIVHRADRDSARRALLAALNDTALAGLETNLAYLRAILDDAVFSEGRQSTACLNDFRFAARGIEVLEAGTQSTVQDWPGRVGYWHIGVPPSGPFDDMALRLGNALLGNAPGAPGLEMTMTGATLKFRQAASIVLAGADMQAMLDGAPLPCWQVVPVPAGGVLALGAVQGAGSRTYVCVAGGLAVPDYLGSASTFTLGGFGGHGGRALRPGDVLHCQQDSPAVVRASLPDALRPALTHHWTLRVIYGPHGAPDFFTPDDIDMLLGTDWQVHYNSSRTGVRLIGPTPQWARADGGEAGLHPSNIHDNAYAIGAVDFTGDMPVILGPDGPSLGGFVCPVTIIRADLWQMGQLRPGDTVRFVPVSQEDAEQLERLQRQQVETLSPVTPPRIQAARPVTPVLRQLGPDVHPVGVVYRVSGDDNILVEYGEQVLDLNLRFRVHALMQWLQQAQLPGVLQLTPGIRSLQVNYDNLHLPREKLLDALCEAERALDCIDDMTVPTRIVHLPLSWDDEQCRLAIEKYMQSVRKDAPWCPSNLEFIRRINGLADIEAVKRIVFDASYLVMGLGDVYLGAPVATPLDPRHRLVTTKYNPARTWTPENAVGIGGAYLCVYGMEGPGGYQFVGRTVQMWNTWKQTAEFRQGQPWLLRFFDQLRFYEVSHDELMQWREDFPRGRAGLKIEEETFSLRDYNRFLSRNAAEIDTFRTHQRQAFAEERQRWAEAGQDVVSLTEPEAAPVDALVLADGERAINSHVPGSIWQVTVEEGAAVSAGETVAVIESMKMEIPVTAPVAGRISRVLVSPGASVTPGQAMLVLAGEVQ